MAPRKPSDLTIGGSEYSVYLDFPKNQVPPPPTEQTSAEIKQDIADLKNLFKDLEKGFGNTTLATYPTLTAFESAKTQTYDLINVTLPEKLKEREDWENKYRIKVSGLFGTGFNEYTVVSADEVYDIQQKYKAATNPNDPELKAYDNAVKAVNDLRTKINTPGSKESKLPPQEQQLLIADALKTVQTFITPKVVELRSQNIPLEIDKDGRTLKQTNFALIGEVDTQINRAINEGVRIAERSFGTQKPTYVDKYGREFNLTTIRNQQQTKQLSEFMDRANTLRNQTPSQAATQPITYTPSGAQPASAGIKPTGASQRAIDAQAQRYEAMAKGGTTAPVVTTGAGIGGAGTAGSAGVGGVGTGAGTKGVIGGGGGETGIQQFKVGDWQALLQEQFPGYSKDWLSANATTHFGQDMINLMIEAAKPNGKFMGLTTDASVAAFKKAIKQTSYWLTTETAAKNFDSAELPDRERLINNKKLEIANTYGDVSFDDATLTQLATNAARLGLTGLGLQQSVYAGALKPGAGGTPTALANRVLQGADADRIRQIGRAWNTKISDSQVQAILTGQPDPATGLVLTEDGLREQLQAKWRGAMPHLKDQFDAGLSLDQIGSSYRSYAAQLLEKPEDQINMFEGPYLQAFDNGQGGQMSLSQWISQVKTDPRFGWQYTKQANQQATDIGLTLARAFGKVA